MDDNEYKLKRIVAICLCVLLTSTFLSCNVDSSIRKVLYANTLNEATRRGEDPMTVGCAWGFDTTGEAAVCAQNQSKR